jgi:hypothetical protein
MQKLSGAPDAPWQINISVKFKSKKGIINLGYINPAQTRINASINFCFFPKIKLQICIVDFGIAKIVHKRVKNPAVQPDLGARRNNPVKIGNQQRINQIILRVFTHAAWFLTPSIKTCGP